MELTTEIQTARKMLGLTCKEAAAVWKLNARTLEAWEAGRNKPRGAALLYLRSILDPILAAKPASPSSAAPGAPGTPPPKEKRRRLPKPKSKRQPPARSRKARG